MLSPASVHHGTSLTAERLIDSFSQDIMYAVSKGEFLTLKHASVGLELHNLTGQKLPLQVLSRLVHSMTYDQICEVETAQAELVQHLKSLSLPLPICPIGEESKVLTTFWWDNFNQNIETASGQGLSTTHLELCFKKNQHVQSITMRMLAFSSLRGVLYVLKMCAQSRQQLSTPKKIHFHLLTEILFQVENHEQMYCNNLLTVWKSLRHLTSLDQVNPRFVGWVIMLFETIDSKQTKLTYLPPIQKPIAEYGTFFEMFRQSRELARKVNMKYTHITLDVGAAIKAYHVIWNNPNLWSDTIIHLEISMQ